MEGEGEINQVLLQFMQKIRIGGAEMPKINTKNKGATNNRKISEQLVLYCGLCGEEHWGKRLEEGWYCDNVRTKKSGNRWVNSGGRLICPQCLEKLLRHRDSSKADDRVITNLAERGDGG